MGRLKLIRMCDDTICMISWPLIWCIFNKSIIRMLDVCSLLMPSKGLEI